MDLSQKLTDINKVSEEIFSVSEYLDISRLPDMFGFTGHDTLPVINETGNVTGIVSEFDLAKVVKHLSISDDGYKSHLTVKDIMTKDVWCEQMGANISSMLDKIEQMHTRVIPIVDREGFYSGLCVTRSKLINYLTRKIKPRTIAGIATPMGVYLTDGIHQAGVKNLGLVSSGLTFAVFIFLIQFALIGFENGFWAMLTEVTLFLSVFRFSSLSRIHASEHMVINAIEKGLPLNLQTVKIQSRVHKRCGTNLIVFLLGVLFIFYFINLVLPKIWLIRFLVSFGLFMGLLHYWKQVGYKIQKYFTTAPPSDEQIQKAIDAGEELLHLHKQDPSGKEPGALSRLFTSGIVQIAASYIFFTSIIQALWNQLW